MKNKVLDIQVGDRVTYIDKQGKKCIVIILEDKGELSDNKDNPIKEIIKVERPKYEVIEDKEILDKEEKKYLWNIIRPFKDKVEGVKKCGSMSEREYISIKLKNEVPVCLPYFSKDSMYKNMKAGRHYSLEELGLEE